MLLVNQPSNFNHFSNFSFIKVKMKGNSCSSLGAYLQSYITEQKCKMAITITRELFFYFLA